MKLLFFLIVLLVVPVTFAFPNCYNLQDGQIVRGIVSLCPKQYNLTKTVTLDTETVINCDGAVMMGSKHLGFVLKERDSAIRYCIFKNFKTAVRTEISQASIDHNAFMNNIVAIEYEEKPKLRENYFEDNLINLVNSSINYSELETPEKKNFTEEVNVTEELVKEDIPVTGNVVSVDNPAVQETEIVFFTVKAFIIGLIVAAIGVVFIAELRKE